MKKISIHWFTLTVFLVSLLAYASTKYENLEVTNLTTTNISGLQSISLQTLSVPAITSSTFLSVSVSGVHSSSVGSSSLVSQGGIFRQGTTGTDVFTGLSSRSVAASSLAAGNGGLFSIDTSGAIQLFGSTGNISMVGALAIKPGGNLTVTPGLSGDVLITGQAVVGASTSPRGSTKLEIAGTDGGLLLPAMTTTQRDALSGPASGLFVYNQTTSMPNFYGDSAWKVLGEMRTGSAYINNSAGTVTINTQTPSGWLTGINDIAAGRTSLGLASGFFSVRPSCVCTAMESVVSGESCMITAQPSLSEISEVRTREADATPGALSESSYMIICTSSQ